MRRFLIMIITTGLLAGCAPWLALENVNTGMTKPEVLAQLGKPTDVAGTGNVEYLWYNPVNRFWQRYYVRLVNGKVESYGPLGSEPEPAK
ncbi:MAG: hypothetical protein FIB02_04690 [Desulfuromonas sp.]|nr:hypothetical protein [Desulfuromonas sp.]